MADRKELGILDTLLKNAAHVVDMDLFYVTLFNKITSELDFPLVARRVENTLERMEENGRWASRPYRPDECLPDCIFASSEAVLIETNFENWMAVNEVIYPTDVPPLSWLGIPMVARGKVIGVIVAENYQREHAYDQRTGAILSAMADRVAGALASARLVENLRAVNAVGQRLTSGIRLREDEVLELIFEQAGSLMDTRNMYIALYDAVRQRLDFPLFTRDGQRAEPFWRHVEIEDPTKGGLTEELIRLKQPLLVSDFAAYCEEKDLEPPVEPYPKSWLGVPMLIEDKVLGVIALLNYDFEDYYGQDDQEVLQAVVSQAAIAIDNARLHYDTNQRLAALIQVGQALNSDIRLREGDILEQIWEQASPLMDTSNMYIALYDAERRRLDFPLMTTDGQRDEPFWRHVEIEDPTKGGLSEELIRLKQPLLVSDFAAYCEEKDLEPPVEPYPKSWLGVPMLIEDRIIGVVALQNYDFEDNYTQADQQVLEAMADQAAIAIENARLFESAQRLFESARRTAQERKRRLALLQEISERMVGASLDPDAVLESVARAANDLSHSDLTSIYRYDPDTSTLTQGVRVRQNGNVEQFVPRPRDLLDPDYLPAEIARTQEPIFVDDVEEHAETFSFARRHRLRAFAGLPLTTASMYGMPSTVGVLFVNFGQPHPFPDDEQEILRHLANQAAVAIAYAGAQESAQAKEQLAALGTAAATLQHRLGNTINVILPAVMRLHYRVGGDPTNEDILNTIERNALFATEVIRRMQTPLRQEPFVRTNVNSLLRDAIRKCVQDSDRFPDAVLATNLPDLVKEGSEPRAVRHQQITITAVLDKSLPDTFASIGQLTEVFRVLVENAIKAIYPQTGIVTITSKLARDRLRQRAEITVSDTGKGIDDKTRSKLFNQPVPRKQFGEGAGLGLWLSKIIVRSHQGSIKLQHTELHKGSTFLVSLPILDEPPPLSASQLVETYE